ncbi:MAG: protein disulfide oxidoreductase [Gammaproteobacteria bacterium]|nr:protein disulfide oxidoreductase [Gammaproteobacteria bacterium]
MIAKVVAYIKGISLRNVVTNLLVFGLGYLLIHTYQTWDVPKGKAPTLAGMTLNDNQYLALDAMPKPVLVHFWATWCKICQFEHASIKRIAEDYPVISVASQSGSATAVKKFMQEQELTFPVIMDADGKVFKQWGGVGFPTSFVINKENEIAFAEAGFTTEWGLRLRLFLASHF